MRSDCSLATAALMLAVFVASPAFAGVVYVDDDALNDPGPGDPSVSDPLEDGTAEHPFDAIQEGIDAAVDGDVVEIADGTYTGAGNKDLDFLGKAITVRSASGDPAVCVIDCEHDGRGFYFHSQETDSSVVEGISVINGSAYIGGAVYCQGASPTLANCTISGNSAVGSGGAAYCSSGSPMMKNCAIIGNSAGAGGGVSSSSGSVTLLINCTISGNSADYDGGGVCCSNGSRATLTNCTIIGNSAGGGGGGVYCEDCSPTLTNCTISGNSADDGGGVACFDGSPILTNCTISDNSAGDDGGGIYCRSSSSPALANCILWDDAPQEVYVESGTPTLTYCCIQGGWDGTGNIDADPGFILPGDYHLPPDSPCTDMGTNAPPGGLPPTDADGTPRPLDGDGDGTAVADIGAFEFDPVRAAIGVSPAELEFRMILGGFNPPDQTVALSNPGGAVLHWTTGTTQDWLTVAPADGDLVPGQAMDLTLTVDGTGLSYGLHTALLEIHDPDAVNSPRIVTVTFYVNGTLHVPGEYPTIQAAIDASLVGDVVELADGTYTGPGNKELDFGGKAITLRSASGNPAACVIDCEDAGRGFYFHSQESASSVVERISVINGSVGGVHCVDQSSPTLANCTMSENEGGGVYCRSSSNPTLTNCTINGNTTGGGGGGVYCYDSSSPTLANCTISENSAGSGGGGVYCGYNSNPTLMNCTINANSAVNGAGVSSASSSPTLINCTISANSAPDPLYGFGGGICCSSGSPTMTNCSISGNSARYGGGVYCYLDSSPTLTNCTLSNNSAYGEGGGVYCRDSSGPTLTNCILWGDTPQEIYVYSGTPTAAYCCVQGGWPGTGNIDTDPQFILPGDYRLQPGSPCIDAGDNGAVPADALDLDGDGDTIEPLPFDFAGRPRFVDDPFTPDTGAGTPPIVDMGAYEYMIDGDCDLDWQITLADFVSFAGCMQGPDVSPEAGCGCTDMDVDADVDLADFAAFQTEFDAP